MHDDKCKIRDHRVAIFERNGNLAIIARTYTSEHNAIGVNDPQAKPALRYLSYETRAEAARWFDRLVAATVAKETKLIYTGPRLHG